MLISLAVTNFKSLRDRTELRMDCSADSDLQHVVRHGIPGTSDYRGMLTVASIHGANASGKSNIIKAAGVLDDIVGVALRFPEGRIPEDFPPIYHPSRGLDPFRLNATSAKSPTELEVAFVADGIKWIYGLSIDVKKVYSERLCYCPNGSRVVELFNRGASVDPSRAASLLDRTETNQTWTDARSGDANSQQECWYWGPEFEKGQSEGRALAGRTRADVPFLSVAASWNHPQASQVINWFRRFRVMDATEGQIRTLEFASRACKSDSVLRQWTEQWMRAADFGISSIQVDELERPPSGSGQQPYRARFESKAVHSDEDGRPVLFDMELESHGTSRLFSMAPMLYAKLRSGGVLLIDELHSGLHPLLLRALVKIFQCPERNPHSAQLIFTTHDISVLDNSLLRRDQIHIVEKNKNGASEIYSLSDYDDKPRKNAPLVKHYLSGYFGGVPDLDIDRLFPLPSA